MHGFQSFIWNKAVSERIRRFGRKVLVGDLVVKKENADVIEEVQEVEEANEEEEQDTNKNGGLDSAVIVVTEANLADYAIEDVVMPMVGHSIRMPPNADLAAIYADLLQQ